MSKVIQFPNKPLAERLQAVLDGDLADIRAEARSFISRPDLAPIQAGLSKEAYREKTLEWVQKMVEAGFTRMPYDPAFGGAGEYKKYMNIVEIIAHQDMSLAIKQGVQFGLFGLSMYSLGTEKHHGKYLPDIMQGKLLGGFAMTEVSGGSDVQGVATEAVYDHETRSFVLQTPSDSARKAYIGNAAKHGKMMVVFAQLKMTKDGKTQGVHAFMVPIRDDNGNALPGITIEDCGHKTGLNGVDNGYLHFNQIKLPYDALLDRFAAIDEKGDYQSDIPKKSQRFFKMISTLVTGRIFVAAASLSGAKNALTSAIHFAENRKVFGETLLDKQATQSRMFPHLANAYALHFATRLLMDKQMDGAHDLETMAAAVKSKGSDQSLRAVDEGRILAGGAGYMSEQRYGALRNDMDIFRTFEGDNTVLRLLVAKNRLGELTQQFNNVSGFKKMTRMASLVFNDKVAHLTSKKSRTSSSHLLDQAAQQDIFAKRESTMLLNLSRKLNSLKKSKGIEFALNACQDDMIAYADAYAEKVMLDRFVEVVQNQADPEVRAALKNVCDLFAVNTMRQNGLWYVENGYMTPEKTKALAAIEHELNEKIRPDAIALVNAFAVPEGVLSAPKPSVAPAAKGPKAS